MGKKQSRDWKSSKITLITLTSKHLNGRSMSLAPEVPTVALDSIPVDCPWSLISGSLRQSEFSVVQQSGVWEWCYLLLVYSASVPTVISIKVPKLGFKMVGGFSVSPIHCCRYHHCCKPCQATEELELCNTAFEKSAFQFWENLTSASLQHPKGNVRIQKTPIQKLALYRDIELGNFV